MKDETQAMIELIRFVYVCPVTLYFLASFCTNIFTSTINYELRFPLILEKTIYLNLSLPTLDFFILEYTM